jgi:hypothetical protein
VHVSAARSKGNESRVGVPPLSFAHAIGQTSSSGGSCFPLYSHSVLYNFLFICVLHLLLLCGTICAGTQAHAHLWGAWSPLCRLLWFAVLAVLVPLDMCSSEAVGPALRTGTLEPPHMLVSHLPVGETGRKEDHSGSPYGREVHSLSSSVLSTYNWVKTSAPYGVWQSITSSSTGQYLAATVSIYGNDNIYTSRDYGSTWTKITASFRGKITSSSMGQYLAATAGYDGIYTSSDYGSTWTKTKTTAPAGYWNAVTSSSTGQYLAATFDSGSGSGGIYTSNDYGSTWENTSAPHGAYLVSSSSTGQYLVSVMCIYTYSSDDDYSSSSTRDCGVYTSSDYGSAWTRTSALTGVNSLASSDTGQYLAAAVSGDMNRGIYTSSDYGATWTATSAPTAFSLWSIASSSTGQYLAAVAGVRGVYLSTDYGATWVDTIAPDLEWNTVTLSSTGQYLVAAVGDGRIYKLDLFPSSQPTNDLPPSNCTAGMFHAEPGVCAACPAGTFSTASMSTCLPCDAGYYSGALSASCTICPAGFHCLPGSPTGPVVCPAGTISPLGASVCTPCPAGQYSNLSASCTTCPAGFYCLPGSPTGPVVCPAGTISPLGASVCTPCPAGHYSNSSSSCVSCPAGFYCLPGSPGRPGMCPAGTISAPGASVCTPCAAGQYSYPGASECLNCSSA